MKTNKKIITCIVTTGNGIKLIKALHAKKIISTAFHHARGSSIGDPVDRKGIPLQQEREIVTVIVPSEIADEIFEFLYDTVDMNRRNNGFIYMGSLNRCSAYQLLDLPEEESGVPASVV
ncbi:MAG: hypothetical protein JXN60_03965 [Lentisphaerae bacterium]|nr:hypothetical protein [Lentisphaerota bacterium]